jgi:hypothetical protein
MDIAGIVETEDETDAASLKNWFRGEKELGKWFMIL